MRMFWQHECETEPTTLNVGGVIKITDRLRLGGWGAAGREVKRTYCRLWMQGCARDRIDTWYMEGDRYRCTHGTLDEIVSYMGSGGCLAK